MTTDPELDNWDKFFIAIARVSKWTQMITNTSLMVALIATIIVVCCVRRRTDCFIVVALICYCISISFQVTYWYLAVSHDEIVSLRLNIYLFLIEKPFYLIAHWAFSAQYLKTCLVLPRLLSEAKIEFDEDTTTRDSRLSNRSSGMASYTLLKQMAEAIENEQRQIKSINLKLLVLNSVMMLLIIIQFVMATLALVHDKVILQYCIE